jgi:hypothetical protein
MPQALSPSDWAAIRAAYETTTDTPVEIARRFKLHHFKIYHRMRLENWARPDRAIQTHSLGSLPPSPLEGEGRGGGNGEAGLLTLKHPPPHVETAQRDLDVVLPLEGGGGEKLEGQQLGRDTTVSPAERPKPPKPKTSKPKRQGMIDRLYRVIDNNLSQLEDIMKNQSDPSIADNEKETRTIGTVIGNIEKLKGLEDDAGKSRLTNKSASPTDTAAATERLGRELAERLSRLAQDLRA